MDAKIVNLFSTIPMGWACALVYLLPFKKCDRNKYPSLDLNTVTGDEEISKEQKHPAGPEQRAVTQAGNIWGTLVRGGQ